MFGRQTNLLLIHFIYLFLRDGLGGGGWGATLFYMLEYWLCFYQHIGTNLTLLLDHCKQMQPEPIYAHYE